MKRTLLPVVLFCLFSLPLHAQDAASFSVFSLLTHAPEFERLYTEGEEPVWYSSIENDALTGRNITDEYYTNAMRVSKLYHLKPGFLYDNFRLYGFSCAESGDDCELPMGRSTNRDLKLVSYGYTMGHQMYTPYEDAGRGHVDTFGYEHLSNAEYYDRPFAAWAFFGRDLVISGLEGYQQHEFSLGVVGPLAQGRWMQENAHQYPFTGPYPIDGWESQVDDRAALQYSGKFATHMWQQPLLFGDSRISRFSLVEAGTIINRLGYGMEAAISWPAMTQCERYSAAEMVNLSFTAKDMVTARLQLLDASTQLKKYRDGNHYIPNKAYLRVAGLIEAIDHALAEGRDEATLMGLMDKVSRSVQDLNAGLRDAVLKSCRHNSVYTRFSADTAVHYVISNYLLEGGIQVPSGANPDSDNAVMREGGVLEVTRKPVIFSASFGVRVGYADSFALDVRYKYRSEETKEQVEPHGWAELALEVKNSWGAYVIPAILILSAAHNQENWPD
ncbi:lipid A-modifier LpxR family protein [Thalassolituus sp. LLYu03]|uniref:lipid A-modifier LpxR family protein n=1 Tax=Thalassolituus sp. LLYu03 TaxID=3421656 RepID=UPI003D2B85EE